MVLHSGAGTQGHADTVAVLIRHWWWSINTGQRRPAQAYRCLALHVCYFTPFRVPIANNTNNFIFRFLTRSTAYHHSRRSCHAQVGLIQRMQECVDLCGRPPHRCEAACRNHSALGTDPNGAGKSGPCRVRENGNPCAQVSNTRPCGPQEHIYSLRPDQHVI